MTGFELPQNVKLLDVKHKDELLGMLSKDPYSNLFMIGNINTYGMDNPDLDYWGYYEAGNLVAVLMRYRYNWGVYQTKDIDCYPFGCLLSKYNALYPERVKNINGSIKFMSCLFSNLQIDRPVSIKEKTLYCLEHQPSVSIDTSIVKQAKPEDIQRLVEFYSHGVEMQRYKERIENTITNLRLYMAEIGSTIVSAVTSNTESPTMAVIGGLFTPNFLRGQGYATACLAKLSGDLLKEGKKPCIFNDDPSVHHILTKVGFKAVGKWKIINYV